MDRNEYMQRLRNKLNTLPSDEIESVIQYYEEYFDEAGTEKEQSVIEELGSPEKAASMIKANYAVKDMESSKGSAKKGLKTVFLVILAIFASPIAIPIAIALFAIVLAVVISLLAVFLSLFIAGAAAAVGGLAMFIAGFLIIIQSPATFLFFAGSGLCSVAIGVALVLITACISKKCFAGLASSLSRFLSGRPGK